MNIPSYDKLGKDNRWRVSADSDFPGEIGGRSTDIVSVYWSVNDFVKQYYDINGVPDQMVKALKHLQESSEICAQTIGSIFETVCADALEVVEKERAAKIGNHVTK